MYDNPFKLRVGELANFDDLFERWKQFTKTNVDDQNPELYTFEQKLQYWEERVAGIDQLGPDYTTVKPGVHVSPETAESMFKVGVGVGAGGAFLTGLFIAAMKRIGSKKRAA